MSYHSIQVEFGDPVEYRSNQQGNGQGSSKVAPVPEEDYEEEQKANSPAPCVNARNVFRSIDIERPYRFSRSRSKQKSVSPTGTETYKRPLSKKERELKEEQIKERLQYKKLRTDLLEKRRKEAIRTFKHANPKSKVVRKTQPQSQNPTGTQKAVDIFQSIVTGF